MKKGLILDSNLPEASRLAFTVLTVDLPLYLAALNVGGDIGNFDRARTFRE